MTYLFAQNIQSHFGALISVLLIGMFNTAEPALLSFPQERPVFLREYSTNHYGVGAYFLSRLTMEAVVTAVQVLVFVSSSSDICVAAGLVQKLIVEDSEGADLFLHDWFPSAFPDGVHHYVRTGHGQHGPSGHCGLLGRRHQDGAGDPSHVVYSANVVCRILRDA